MSALFGRSWTFDITPPGATVAARYGSLGDSPSDLHMTFAIERTVGSDANKGKITLTNLTPDNRNALAQGTSVTLRAGYGGQPGIIFQGVVRKVESAADGPDVVTTLECGDGEPYITYGHVHLSYSSTVTLAQVLVDVAAQLQVTIGGQVYGKKGVLVQNLPLVTYRRLAKGGKVKTILDGLLHPHGMAWSIQNGVLLIQDTAGRINLEAIVLSPATGLIDTPTRTDAGVKVRALLNPRLVPGCAIQVVSTNKATCGNFRAVKCTYQGDSETGDWAVEVEGGALYGPLAPYVATTQDPKSFQGAVYDDPDEVDGAGEEVEE